MSCLKTYFISLYVQYKYTKIITLLKQQDLGANNHQQLKKKKYHNVSQTILL